jgi:hypothetical protein
VTEDRFDAAGIRHRVLAAWSASPARFREDANAEEDLVLGGYRDRVIVELAQNAADAAAALGDQPGRLLLTLQPDDGRSVLVAANTGAPLDAAGVQALATLRASAKRDGDTVGRFGVGFASMLAITDEPAVISRSGGVRFSAADTRQLVEDAALSSAELGVELLRREGQVPVLRLPFAAEGTPVEGYDTAVLLPLRDVAAEDLVSRLLDDVRDPVLLALPGLDEIVVERPDRPRLVLRDPSQRWHILRREGRLTPQVLAGRPTEESGRSHWEVTWALPHEGIELPTPAVLYAPTPSDEPLPWPALLIATMPLEPSRRHVAPGAVTDALIAAAADAYLDLLSDRAAAGADVWPLIVTGLPAGKVDAALREAVTSRLPSTALLASAEDSAILLRPQEAVALSGSVGADVEVVRVFASWVAGLVLAPRAARAAFDLLGVRRLSLADAVEALPAVADPERWHQVYAALAPLAGDESVREALAFLPVPLADGSVVRGIRGLLLATPADVVDGSDEPEPRGTDLGSALAVLGARVVHPEAVHPLLERLGALTAGPRALLELPMVAAAVESLADEPGADLDAPPPDLLLDAVLTLVASAVGAGQLGPGELPWLGDLPLADEVGDLAPAATLALPGSSAAGWFDPDDVGVVAADLVERWGEATLAAVGVLNGPGLLRAHDVPLEPDELADDGIGPAAELDGWDDWCAVVLDGLGHLPPGAVLSELIAVRDLDLVRPDALPEVVAAIAADPVLRQSVVLPVRIIADRSVVDVPPYTAWWLRGELASGTDRTGALAAPEAEMALQLLLPLAPDWVLGLDPAMQRALGVLSDVSQLDRTAVPELLDRLADPDLEMPADTLVRVLGRIAELAAEGLELERPSQVRGVDGASSVVVPADEAVIVEAPMYRQRADLGVQLPVAPESAAALADLFDLPLARELAAGDVFDGEWLQQPTSSAVRGLLPEAPTTWREHEQLIVDGVDVDWWVDGEGVQAIVHAATTDGLARALAWAAGQWDLRDLVGSVLAEPEIAVDVVIDQVFSGRRLSTTK